MVARVCGKKVNVFRNRTDEYSAITNLVTSNTPDAVGVDPKVPRKSKRKDIRNIPKEPQNVYIAVRLVKDNLWANFDETVEVAINLNVDPRKQNQAVKGVALLPHGTGKKIRVGVFTQGANVQAAIDAGADVVGAEDLIARVQSGDIPFDRVIATPDVMQLLGKIGKVLFSSMVHQI